MYTYEPLVSIVIPVYNGSNYLAEAIDSALSQTYKNIEILVINDGSKDNGKTEEIAKSYGTKIRYFSKENGGVSTALNMAIREMHGEWLSWLSHDDKYLPDKVKKQVKELNVILSDDSNCDIYKTILYGGNECIDSNGKKLIKKGKPHENAIEIKDIILNNIKHYNIGGCTVLASKKAYDEVGFFDVDIPTVSDVDMWFRMMLAGYRFTFMDTVLVQSRQHSAQVGKTKQALFEKQLSNLHIKLAKKLSNIFTEKNDLWRLTCYLKLRGFDAASDIARNVLETKYNKLTLVQKLTLTQCKIKHNLRNIIRDIYRFVTVK